MATIRDNICEQLLARLKSLSGYRAERRHLGENDANHKLLALLLAGDESVLGSDTLLTQKELAIEVLVQVRAEDAPPSLGGNPERYLDQEIGRVEGILFTPANFDNIDLRPDGWTLITDPGSNLLRAVLRLTAVYSHNIGDPSTFNPAWVS